MSKSIRITHKGGWGNDDSLEFLPRGNVGDSFFFSVNKENFSGNSKDGREVLTEFKKCNDGETLHLVISTDNLLKGCGFNPPKAPVLLSFGIICNARFIEVYAEDAVYLETVRGFQVYPSDMPEGNNIPFFETKLSLKSSACFLDIKPVSIKCGPNFVMYIGVSLDSKAPLSTGGMLIDDCLVAAALQSAEVGGNQLHSNLLKSLLPSLTVPQIVSPALDGSIAAKESSANSKVNVDVLPFKLADTKPALSNSAVEQSGSIACSAPTGGIEQFVCQESVCDGSDRATHMLHMMSKMVEETVNRNVKPLMHRIAELEGQVADMKTILAKLE